MKSKSKKIITGIAIAGAIAGVGGSEMYTQKQIGDFRSALANRGVAEENAETISRYFHGREGNITYNQQKQLTEAYNKQLQEIRKDCEADVRCKDGKINLGNYQNKKEMVDNLNRYILEDYKEPGKYKIKK